MTNAGASITWHADENERGHYVVRRGGTNCTDGTIVVSSTADLDLAQHGDQRDHRRKPQRGCQHAPGVRYRRAANTGASENFTVTKDTTAPTVTIDSITGSTGTDSSSPTSAS